MADGRVGLTNHRVLEGDTVYVFNGAPTAHNGVRNGEIDRVDVEDQDFVLI